MLKDKHIRPDSRHGHATYFRLTDGSIKRRKIHTLPWNAKRNPRAEGYAKFVGEFSEDFDVEPRKTIKMRIKKEMEKEIGIMTQCPFCGSRKVVNIDADLMKLINNDGISAAYGRLSDDDRERLISGICPECWDKEVPNED